MSTATTTEPRTDARREDPEAARERDEFWASLLFPRRDVREIVAGASSR